MTLKGLISRWPMLWKVLSIAFRSLRAGAYLREATYLKYTPQFEKVVSGRDPRRGLTVTTDECFTIYSSIKSTEKLDGSIAEVGVYKGNTAKLICGIKDEREFFLFDTFEGMPSSKITVHDDWESNTHQDTSLESVQSYLNGYSNVYFIKGEFPESIKRYPERCLEDKRFSFVYLDVDLYTSTLDGLKFFYPRLTQGGRLVSHNFNEKDNPGGRTPGVRKAFREFFAGSEHKIIEIAETQCMVIKD
jgi:O-methyltransferase